MRTHHINIIRLANAQKSVPVFVGAIADLNVTAFDDTSITLDWTTPSTDNPIDYFEVWVDNVFYENTTDDTEGWTVTGLTASTSYNIKLKTVDTLGNKSAFSNEVTQATTGGAFDFTTALVAYWKYNGNSNDSSGNGHNGTDTSMSYGAGQVGDCAIFNGSTSKIIVPDADGFSFTNGSSDVPFTILIPFNFTIKTGAQFLINKREIIGTTQEEWQIDGNGTDLRFVLYGSNTASFIIKSFALSLVTAGTWNYLAIRGDGSELHTGLSMRLNKSEVGTSSVTGTYTGCINSNARVFIGKRGTLDDAPFDGKLDEGAIYYNRRLTDAECDEAADRFFAGTPLI